MRIVDPLFQRPSTLELDGITVDPVRESSRFGEPEDVCRIAPLLVAGLIAGGAALAGGATGLALNKKFEPKAHDIDEEAFDNPYFRSSRSAAIMERDAARNRTGPTATSAQQGGIREFGGAQLGQSERAGVAQLGPANQGTAAQVARDEDRQFRSQQQLLAAQLAQQAAGQGPSLATQQLKQATDRNIAQQAAMAAAGGGNPALAQRNVAQTAAQLGRSAAADAAQLRVQEQLAAREQLAGVLAGARGQDIGVAQTQAQLAQQMGLANVEALNQFALEQARLTQQGRQFDVGAANEFALQRAQLQQQAGLASQAQYNEMLARNVQNEQQVRLANMEAELRQRGMNDEQIRAMMGMQLAQEEAQRQAMMDRERLAVQQNAAMQGIALQGAEGSANRTQAIIGGLFGGLGAAGAAASDPRGKDDMRPMGPKASLSKKLAGKKVEARQLGGPVMAGNPYLVGERGPEIIVPQQAGTVVPNEAISTWGTGNKSPEAFWAGEKAAELDKKSLDLAMKRSLTKDAAREASNQAIALDTRQRFEAEAKEEDKKKEAEWRKRVAPIQQGARQFGEAMGQTGPTIRVDAPQITAGPRTTLAQYLSQFGGKF